MSDVTSMWKQLRFHRILLDTFSDIQPEPKGFLKAFEPAVCLDPIRTPVVLIIERRAIEQRIHSWIACFLDQESMPFTLCLIMSFIMRYTEAGELALRNSKVAWRTSEI
jgi:hypothetical protein